MLTGLFPQNLPLFILRNCLLVCAIMSQTIYAEQLPVRTYQVADGLAHDKIQSIFRDSHGFLWFSTYDGLSRFDGAHFTNYGVKDGLPLAYTNCVFESRDGIYWIATNGGGVSRFDPTVRVREAKVSAASFTTYSVGDVPASNRIDVVSLVSGHKSNKFNCLESSFSRHCNGHSLSS